MADHFDQFLLDHQGFEAARLSADLEPLTGSRQRAVDAVRETILLRAAVARPAYAAAMHFDAGEVPEIVEAFQRETKSGLGADVLRSREFKGLEIEYGIDDLLQAPLMRVIDAWRKAVDDVARSLARSGHKNAARVVGDMRDRVLAVVDQHNPIYKAARDMWAGPTKYIAALERGHDIIKDSADDVRAALAELGASEREAYVTGALAAIFKKLISDPQRGHVTK
jgi:hypothetical protein